MQKKLVRHLKNLIFPFTAIVGQEDIKKALILNAINPGIGGVLIKGDRGTGKTTAVRALADLLPSLEVVKGCPFNCNPHDRDSLCEFCQTPDMEIEEKKMRVVELPLGSTEDRVVGSLDIKKALKEGIKALEPGILAEANRNILYVDEINLLDDHLVDVLLDAAAYGINNVEREGISISHPSKFILVGTMNPAEGDLRPQLSDRIGLHLTVHSILDIKDRISIMHRREQFEKDPEGFKKSFENTQKELQDKIIKARALLPQVTISTELMELIARVCVEAGVDGHRSDIAILKTSKAIASYNQQKEVKYKDVEEAITLVLGERSTGKPQNPQQLKNQLNKAQQDMEKEKKEEKKKEEESQNQENSSSNGDSSKEEEKNQGEDSAGEEQNQDDDDDNTPEEESPGGASNSPEENESNDSKEDSSSPHSGKEEETNDSNKSSSAGNRGPEKEKPFVPNPQEEPLEGSCEEFDIKKMLKMKGKKKKRLYGARVDSKTDKGKYVKSRLYSPSRGDIAIDATLRAAALKSQGEIKVESGDLREKIRKHGARASIALVVDISGSMHSDKKARRVRGIISEIIKDAHRHKDKLTVIGFKGKEAQVIIPTTRRVSSFQEVVGDIQVGGTTPMAAGIKKGVEVLKNEMKKEEYVPLMVLLTDGMPNVGIDQNPAKDALKYAHMIEENHINALVVNFERSKAHGRNMNMELALASGGRYYELEDLQNPGNAMCQIMKYERSHF